MSSHPNLIAVDHLYSSHIPLIKGTGIYGIIGNRSRYYPQIGTTILISDDRLFTNKWHEAAHGFINFWYPLGEIVLTLSNILHVLFLEINSSNKKQAHEIDKIFNRIIKLRNRIAKVFSLSHEIFALSTEMIAGACSFPPNVSTLIDKSKTNFIDYLGTLITKQGFNIHKNAFNIIMKFINIYGDFFYCKEAVHGILSGAPFLITNVQPYSILFENIINIDSLIPDIDCIYNFLIENPPYNFYPDKFSVINDKIRSAYKYFGFHFKLPSCWKHFEWIKEFDKLLPLEKFSDLYRNNVKAIYEFQIAGNHKMFSSVDRNTIIDKDKVDIAADTDVLWRKLPDTNNAFIDFPILPPPLTLSKEDNVLKLYLRCDLNNSFGLSYIGEATTKMIMIENIIGNMQIPAICFFYHSLKKKKGCKYGPEKCNVILETIDLISRYKSIDSNLYKPLLLCCRDDFVYVIEFQTSKNIPRVIGKIPFKFIVYEPKLFHANIGEEARKAMKRGNS